MPPTIVNYAPLELKATTRHSTIYKTTPLLPLKHLSSSTSVAIKQTYPEEESPPHNSLHELSILKSFQLQSQPHPNVCQLLDSFPIIDDGVSQGICFPWYAADLNGLLKCNSKCVRRKRDILNSYLMTSTSTSTSTSSKALFKNEVPLDWCDKIMAGLASALQFIHSQGIIHRDIKPENIMFNTIEDPTPILIDFGIAYDLQNSQDQHPLESNPDEKFTDVCTSVYKPPEAIFGLRNYKEKLDVWSLGMVLTKVYSDDLQCCINEDEYSGDIQLLFHIFNIFGRPNLQIWPEAERSSTFMSMCGGDDDDTQGIEKEDNEIDLKKLMPRASVKIRQIFQKMMVYQSTERLSAGEILQMLEMD